MFNKLSEVVKSAVDVVAPPATAIQELEYKWKTLKTFYSRIDEHKKGHIADTNIPHYLMEMLHIILEEDQSSVNEKECLRFVLDHQCLNLMTELALADFPPGIRGFVLTFIRKFISNLRHPPLMDPNVYNPIIKMLDHVNLVAGQLSPYEKEEVFFVVAVVAAVSQYNCPCQDFFVAIHSKRHLTIRKNSNIPQNNSLFMPNILETCPHTDKVLQAVSSEVKVEIPSTELVQFKCDCDGQSQFLLMVPLIQYLNSPSHEVVIKACEGLLILIGLQCNLEEKCDTITNTHKDLISVILEKLSHFYSRIPDDIDAVEVDFQPVSWGLNIFDSSEKYFIGRGQLKEFLGWLAYFDSICKECSNFSIHPFIKSKFRELFLEDCIEKDVTESFNPSKLVILSKMSKHLQSTILLEELSDWLIEVDTNKRPSSVFFTLIENALDSTDLAIETLALVESFIDRPNEKVLNSILFSFVDKRNYLIDPNQINKKPFAPENILKIINDYLLLLPKQILGSSEGGTCYEDYVQDASGHYRMWIEKTKSFNWNKEQLSSPENSTTDCETPKNSLCNDSGISEDQPQFDEGPLLKMLFSYIRNIAQQPYEINLAVIAVMSKLAFLPHPRLHELLLNPELSLAPNVNTLTTTLHAVANDILIKLPLIENFQERLAETSRRLLIEGEVSRNTSEELLLESVIILSEFCKELAAISFVKYHFATE